MNKRNDNLLNKFKKNKRVIGTSISSIDPQISGALACAGYDLIWIDTEHSILERRDVFNHIVEVQSFDIPALVRVPWNDPVFVKPYLDMGCDGLIFPMISSAREAKNAIESITYPPNGIRGYGPLRANNYGFDTSYVNHARENTLCFLQIESTDAVNDINNICAIHGVNALLIGAMDLSASLGRLGDFKNAEYISSVKRIIKAADNTGITVGCCVPNRLEDLHFYLDLGIGFLLVEGDISMLARCARSAVEEIRGVV